MSRFLFGVINHNIDSPYEGAKNIEKFTDLLYTIQEIGIKQRLSILIGSIQSNDPDDLYELIPECSKDTEMSFSFLITKSPMDNTSDNLFVDWEYEAGQEAYVPGEAKVFKELENFFEQAFALKEVKSIWLRYKSMFACKLNKLKNIKDLELQIYEQCRSSYTFQIDDFEIYKEKNV